MKILTAFILLLMILTVSCHEADQLCLDLEKDLLALNDTGVIAVLDPWLSELLPHHTTADPSQGHKENLNYFMDQLSSVCNLEVVLGCYACIETLPPQSEVVIKLDSAGILVERVLDILTPENSIMSIRTVHD